MNQSQTKNVRSTYFPFGMILNKSAINILTSFLLGINLGADCLRQRVGTGLDLESCLFSKMILPVTLLTALCEGSDLGTENCIRGLALLKCGE